MADQELPSLKRMRREAAICGTIWAIATFVVCGLCYVLGYDRPDRPMGLADVQAVWGIPRWFALGVLFPWAVCGAIALVVAVWIIRDDDLGLDRTEELEEAIHQGKVNELGPDRDCPEYRSEGEGGRS